MDGTLAATGGAEHGRYGRYPELINTVSRPLPPMPGADPGPPLPGNSVGTPLDAAQQRAVCRDILGLAGRTQRSGRGMKVNPGGRYSPSSRAALPPAISALSRGLSGRASRSARPAAFGLNG